MTQTYTIPTLQTDRLTLRAPRADDFAAFSKFALSDRTDFIGGPFTIKDANRMWGSLAGQWVLRGYGSFVACLKDGTPVGSLGCWHPMIWPEPEFGWTLWSANHEGKGYVTEALRTIMPWAWDVTGFTTFVSYIDASNLPSAHVARALGATFDQAATDALNGPDSLFYDPDEEDVHVYRHVKGAA
ncbi:GNAT family N-acetyltransferase [Pseudooctadecabacter jejudonensis]|uniref:N-acetyltransferase domain-containing protein n=1 Tax=Pseudooctadecabacter jejudonensis TaxID=1391910 RepID=A0A1Y5T784_9RHOB|nr:GNAT family N-acetyltransferase [Pseudooctadecabacter jejudonensis]SLN55574.1 hypothetical protein PSJ8397_02927 [Pseudooctadecabacter jejudonensis]